MKKIILLLMLSFISFLEGVTFDQLDQSYDQQKIQIRGFLYKADEGKWVLAAEPGIKSCCLGNKKHVFVYGDVGQPKPGRVYTIEGTFVFEQNCIKDVLIN